MPTIDLLTPLAATAVALPLALAVEVVLGRRRVARGWAPRRVRREGALDLGIVLGTVPWLWMTLAPRDAEGAVRLVPVRDIIDVVAAGDGLVQIVGNLLVFAAAGALLPIRFRLARPRRVLLAVAGIAAAAASAIELLQLALDLGRVTAVDDVLLNTAGAVVFAALTFPLWRSRKDARPLVAASESSQSPNRGHISADAQPAPPPPPRRRPPTP